MVLTAAADCVGKMRGRIDGYNRGLGGWVMGALALEPVLTYVGG